MTTESTSANEQPLYVVKGMLTKFMRMLFPLEFRIDSLANSGANLPFHYPLMPGEMIYLPETVAGIGGVEMARDYYIVTAAHLAARHEFGTFDLKLADIPGFEERAETGVEALESYVSSFDDPALAGALMRLCESARIDAELKRRYRGLAPRVVHMNEALAETLRPHALSTMLVKASLGVAAHEDDPAAAFIQRADELFMPLRAPEADVTQSALRAAAMYEWLQALMAAAREAGADAALGEGAAEMRNDLIGAVKGADEGGDGMSDGEEAGDAGGETDQITQLEASGRNSKGKGGRALSPEEIRKLLEKGAQLKPSQTEGGAEGEGMYLTQLLGKDAQELDQLREQLGEIGTLPGA